MKILSDVLLIGRALAILIILSAAGLIVNAIQVLSLLIRPFSQKCFRSINCTLARWWWSLLVDLASHVCHIELSGDLSIHRDRAIVVSNHQAMTDIVAVLTFAKKCDRLSVLKWYVKEPLRYLPGIGWGLVFLDTLFVRRNWYSDRDKIDRTFRKYLVQKLDFWLVTFSEGTRLIPAKLLASQEFAKNKGLPDLQHVLTPRTRGFAASVTGLRSALDAVYDVTLAYDRSAVSVWQLFCGKLHRLCIYVKRYEIDDLPEGESDLATWLNDRFVEKDKRLAQFKLTGALTL